MAISTIKFTKKEEHIQILLSNRASGPWSSGKVTLVQYTHFTHCLVEGRDRPVDAAGRRVLRVPGLQQARCRCQGATIKILVKAVREIFRVRIRIQRFFY